jgi:2-haloacid dehalogenase
MDQPGRRHKVTTDDMGLAHVTTPAPVHAVVFDVGNVLYQWSLRAIYVPRIADADELNWFLCNVVTQQWHFQHDAGRPIADMVAERKAEFPDYANLIDVYAAHFNESIFASVPGSLEIVNDLAARGVPIFGITNFGAEFWAGFRPTAPVFDHFTDIIVSGEEKLMKPDAAIYHLALRRFGLAPGEGIFVDDRLENVVAADANGFVGHHFVDATVLREDLKARGLL